MALCIFITAVVVAAAIYYILYIFSFVCFEDAAMLKVTPFCFTFFRSFLFLKKLNLFLKKKITKEMLEVCTDQIVSHSKTICLYERVRFQ